MAHQPMTAHVYTDGASKSNPGPAAYGCWLMIHGRLSWGFGCYLGDKVSNNVAEYSGIVRGLELAVAALDHYDITNAVLYTDSQLAARQLSGEYECRDAKLRPLFETAQAFIASAKKPIAIVHILRESNTLADAMANEAISRHGNVSSLSGYVSEGGAVPSRLTAPEPRPMKKRSL